MNFKDILLLVRLIEFPMKMTYFYYDIFLGISVQSALARTFYYVNWTCVVRCERAKNEATGCGNHFNNANRFCHPHRQAIAFDASVWCGQTDRIDDELPNSLLWTQEESQQRTDYTTYKFAHDAKRRFHFEQAWFHMGSI